MRGQSAFIIGIIAAIIIAVFAVINVDAVPVNYLFGTSEWPLILVILGSVFLGAAVAGAMGMVRILKLQSEVKRLRAGNSISGSSSDTTTPPRSTKSKTPATDSTKQ
ncbi:LapA family protein [Alkalicoccobacillus plakortidis]|uniref:Lipopolysaccharide assembly protein LapA domain-containing protein n=1 Tax=Alkalicoccobacillus plakortidis TaxID=444060 RepID=A0ABT0XKV2_9BACI|nr:lipopolysaccharide assembly protein LapA domain-containing protein [Alkalicoccobacillus plakortidis]MCM2676539.1 lipopolysaccharide assembly protein LapA domain-containing protein [Alkalicoccobacillus plakortidis]